MASNSEHGQWWDADFGDLDADEPLSAGFVRNAVANNLQHLVDSAGQVLACKLIPETGTYGNGYVSALSTTNWQYMDRVGPFPVRVRHDGWSFGVVCSLGVSQGSSGSVTWTATLVPMGGRAPRRVLASTDAGVVKQIQMTKTTTVKGWVPNTGTGGFRSAHLDPAEVAEATQGGWSTPITVGGAPERVPVVMCDVEIGVKMSSTGLAARLHNVMVREFDSGDYP